jgi:hypothetical protein
MSLPKKVVGACLPKHGAGHKTPSSSSKPAAASASAAAAAAFADSEAAPLRVTRCGRRRGCDASTAQSAGRERFVPRLISASKLPADACVLSRQICSCAASSTLSRQDVRQATQRGCATAAPLGQCGSCEQADMRCQAHAGHCAHRLSCPAASARRRARPRETAGTPPRPRAPARLCRPAAWQRAAPAAR